MTTITRERLTKILIETMALIKQRSSCTGDSFGISTEVNAELFAEITRMALASLDAVTSYPEKLPCPVFLEPGLRFSKGVTTSIMLDALQRRAEYNAELDAMTPEQRAEHDAGIAAFKAMLGQPVITDKCSALVANEDNSPVIGIDPALAPDRSVEIRYFAPPGWMMVPIEPTEHMIVEGFESEPDENFSDSDVWEEYQAMSGCRQAAHRANLCWAAMIAAVPTKEGA